jgi:transposase-like protein
MSKRKKYSPQFKQGAVELLHQSNVSIAQVARELGIEPNMLSRWSREALACPVIFGPLKSLECRRLNLGEALIKFAAREA